MIEIWLVDQVCIMIVQGVVFLLFFEFLQYVFGVVLGLYWVVLWDEVWCVLKLFFEFGKLGQEVLCGQVIGVCVDGLCGLEFVLVNVCGEFVDLVVQCQFDIVLFCINGNLVDMCECQLVVCDGDLGDEIELLVQFSVSFVLIFCCGDLWELLLWLVLQVVWLNVEGFDEFKWLCVCFGMFVFDVGW